VVAKRVGEVTIRFAAGQERAQASATAAAYVDKAAATLPQEVREQLTRRRKAGQEDAAVDPLSTPQVRQAVLRASFEALVGFQLTDEQLRYNATR
jgi:multidrug efflux pump subunit AcrB